MEWLGIGFRGVEWLSRDVLSFERFFGEAVGFLGQGKGGFRVGLVIHWVVQLELFCYQRYG